MTNLTHISLFWHSPCGHPTCPARSSGRKMRYFDLINFLTLAVSATRKSNKAQSKAYLHDHRLNLFIWLFILVAAQDRVRFDLTTRVSENQIAVHVLALSLPTTQRWETYLGSMSTTVQLSKSRYPARMEFASISSPQNPTLSGIAHFLQDSDF